MTSLGLARVLHPSRRVEAGWIAAAACLGVVVGVAATAAPIAARGLAGVSVMIAYLVIALRDRDLGIGLALGFLMYLGLIRRALIPFIGWPAFVPLLLLGPACAAILIVTARRRPRATGMSAVGLVLGMIVLVQVLNPTNTDLFSALLATLFWLGPLLWFFVGRTMNDARLERSMRVVTIALVPIIVHGLLQSFGTFLPFEYTWVGVSGFGDAIFLDGFKIRPFSTLVSPQEYGYVLSFGLQVIWARLLLGDGKRGRLGGLFAVGTAALFLQASRGIFLFFVIASMVTAVARMRTIGARMVTISALVIIVAAGAMQASGSGLPSTGSGGGSSSAVSLARHQVNGFLAPQESTLPLHAELVAGAFATAAERPLGVGLSEGSIAEQKARGDSSANPENDIATVFLSLGVPGGVIFLAFMVMGIARAARRFRRARTAMSLAALGVTVAFITQWWSGQMYAASALLWLILGWLARPEEGADA